MWGSDCKSNGLRLKLCNVQLKAGASHIVNHYLKTFCQLADSHMSKMQCCLITTHLWFVTCQNQICLHPFQCTEKVGGWSRCRCYRCNRETWLLSCSCIVQALHPFTFLVTFNPTIKVTQNLPPLEISPKKFICIGWLWKPECRNAERNAEQEYEGQI